MTYQISYAGTTEFDLESKYRELHRLLETHDCEVVFTKVDGSERVMPCTLRADELPARPIKEETTLRPLTHKTISVWCLDSKGWRSFRVENVSSIKVLK